jgi:hypothetical protein
VAADEERRPLPLALFDGCVKAPAAATGSVRVDRSGRAALKARENRLAVV